MKPCRCISCSISRALEKDEFPKELSDMFLLGYYYFGMTHKKNEDTGYAEGFDFYTHEILCKDFPTYNKRIKNLIKTIKGAKI